jgi:Polyketide cyclase / dehydrase and lipid transport
MGRVSVTTSVPGRASEVEALWYDPVRWPTWVDGFGHVVEVGEDWPGVGARVVWNGLPGGRGRVLERVVRHEARLGQELEIEDERLRGRRRVAFEPGPDAVTVTLALDYELKERHMLSWAVDLVSVRPAMAASLRRTLERFARERVGDVEWDPEAGR